MSMTAREVDLYVGQRMRQRREALGVSQGKLARHLGLTFSQVQKYEKGSNRIGAGRLYLLADFLGVPVEYFFEGLAHGPAAPAKIGASGGLRPDVALLNEAFLSIDDHETRQSLIALVRSLAGPAPRLDCGGPPAPAPAEDPHVAASVSEAPRRIRP